MHKLSAPAFSPRHVFVSSSGSLYRLALPLNADRSVFDIEPVPVGERSNYVFELRYIDGKLYVFKQNDRLGNERFLVSSDDGANFTDLTKHFYFPEFSPTAPYLPPDDITLDGGRLYVRPGGRVNLFYQAEDGSWLSARGGRTLADEGIAQKFTVHDGVAIWGGEGILFDSVEIWMAELSAAGDSWSIEPQLVHSTFTDGVPSNRNIMGIAANPDTGTFFLGAEGAILRSDSRGEEFSYALRYYGDPGDPGDIGVAPEERERWPYVGPYIHQFLFPSIGAEQVLAAGWDKGYARAYLAWSADDGKTWTNITEILENYITEDSSLVFLFETPAGNIFAGVASRPEENLTLVEIELPSAAGEFFPDAKFGGGGYWETASLGWAYGAYFPWLWIHQQGVWAYVAGESEANMWLWDQELGWLWTSPVVTPHFYRLDTGSYLYYAPESRAPRWFYDLAGEEWMSMP